MKIKLSDLLKKNNTFACIYQGDEISKDKIFDELSKKDSVIYELLKEEVFILFHKTGNFIPYKLKHLKDSSYTECISMCIRQIKKNKYKKKVFFLKEPITLENILRLIKNRLVNNLKTIVTTNKDLFYYQNMIISDVYEYKNIELDSYLIDKDILKLIQEDKKLVKSTLLRLLKDYQITVSEVNYLMSKFNFNMKIDNAYIGSEMIKFTSTSGSSINQSYLSFDDEEDCA